MIFSSNCSEEKMISKVEACGAVEVQSKTSRRVHQLMKKLMKSDFLGEGATSKSSRAARRRQNCRVRWLSFFAGLHNAFAQGPSRYSPAHSASASLALVFCSLVSHSAPKKYEEPQLRVSKESAIRGGSYVKRSTSSSSKGAGGRGSRKEMGGKGRREKRGRGTAEVERRSNLIRCTETVCCCVEERRERERGRGLWTRTSEHSLKRGGDGGDDEGLVDEHRGQLAVEERERERGGERELTTNSIQTRNQKPGDHEIRNGGSRGRAVLVLTLATVRRSSSVTLTALGLSTVSSSSSLGSSSSVAAGLLSSVGALLSSVALVLAAVCCGRDEVSVRRL